MAIGVEDVLAGPIVRRVEPSLVSVWVALRKPASLRLEVFRSVGTLETLGAPMAQVPRPPATSGRRGLPPDPHTLAVGVNLHIGLAVFEPAAQARLDWGSLYSYNLWLVPDDGGPAVDFAALDLLRDRAVRNHFGRDQPWLALGYQPGWLPSFAMPPAEPLALRLAHGSCRWAAGDGQDAMPILDEIIGGAVGDPLQRLHMLWLTGDQIYADANRPEYGRINNWVAQQLFSSDGTVVEHVPVRFETEPQFPTHYFPLDLTHFPPGRRLHLLQHLPGNRDESIVRGFTSDKQDSHNIGFSEYCANYVTAFANTLWPDLRTMLTDRGRSLEPFINEYLPLRQAIKDAPSSVPRPADMNELRDHWSAWRLVPSDLWPIDDYLDEYDPGFVWVDIPHNDDWGDFWRAYARAGNPRVPAWEAFAVPPMRPRGTVIPDENRRRLARALTPLWLAGKQVFGVEVNEAGEITRDLVRERLHSMKTFEDGLPRVRRLLANIPTYMVFDDHEIADDWNITAGWVTAVRGNPLGRAILRNGLSAFVLFQAWGNDPRAYAVDGVRRRVLERVSRLLLDDEGAASPNGPDPTDEQLENLRALDRELDNLPLTEEAPAAHERMHWHFRYDGPGYEVIALDTRTWRSYEPDADPNIGQPFTSEANAPLMTDEALHLQIPADPPAGVNPDGLCVVISAVPVLGMPPVESFAQPILNLHDIVEPLPSGRWAKYRATNRRGRINYDPEPWGYVPRLLEALLERLSSRRRVIFLSGDVHYSFMSEMAYWKRSGSVWDPIRFVQCTGSSYRAQQPISRVEYFAMDVVQQIASEVADGVARLGWRKGLPGGPDDVAPLEAPSGTQFNDRIEYLLQNDPVLIPPRALPSGTVYATGVDGAPRLPAWAWRQKLVSDQRPDRERLIGQLPPPLLPTSDGWPQMLQSAANRVIWTVEHAADRRWMWWTNATIVDFVAGPTPEVRQSVYCFDLSNPANVPRPFMVTRTTLDVPPGAVMPTVPPSEPPEDV